MLAVAAVAGAIAGADGHLPAALGGVAVAGPAGLVVAGGVAVAALAARRPAWLCLGVALLAGVLAQRSVAGLAPPPTGPVRGEVTLVSDPEPDGRGGVAMDVRLDGRRLRAFARVLGGRRPRRPPGRRAGGARRPGPAARALGAAAAPPAPRRPARRRDRHRLAPGRRGVPGRQRPPAHAGVGAECLPARQQSLLAGPHPRRRPRAASRHGRRLRGGGPHPPARRDRARTWRSCCSSPRRCSRGCASARAWRRRWLCWPASRC